MGSAYQSQTAAGYSASPPADDGTVAAANKIKYSLLKTQLGDPVKGLADAINTALRTALNVTPSTQSTAYTTTTADHLRPIEVTGTTTISLGDAATMVAQAMGYEVPIINTGVAIVTVALITAANTLNGSANGTVKLLPGQAARFAVNSTNNGYDIVAMSSRDTITLTGVAGTNTITAGCDSLMTALAANQIFLLTPANTNTGATTLNITPSGGSALTAKNVFSDGAACVGGELKASVPVLLQYDGTQFNILPSAANGEYRSVQVFTSNGTYTAPARLKRAKITVIGGGAAGGGAPATGGAQVSGGSGGGAGGIAVKTVSAATIGASQTVTIGAGGTGVSGANGNDGGTTSFGAILSATGGSRGTAAGPAASVNPTGGAGGVGSSGDVNGNGAPGGMTLVSNAIAALISGVGGSSMFGGGGIGPATAGTVGGAASGLGAGGSGCTEGASGAAVTGGAGTGGICIVEEFF